MSVDSGIGFVQDAAMVVVDSTALQRRAEDVLHQAQSEPVEIIRHGRRAFVLMSADHYDWLRAAAQRRHRTTDAEDVVVRAVERTEMDTSPHR